ncbi:MAG: cobalamin-dependent protein [Patescibacteria group bacterium]|nr:cobalamin-dependent protein [Patescibacteria group bacterium]MDD5715752.1 cobalamin-dependent protein [Patescibacteria group bacterium]
MQNVHFTPPQLAPLFGVNVSTIKRWVNQGYLKAEITPGGHRRISREQLTEFIEVHPKYAKNSYVLRRLKQHSNCPNNDCWKRYYRFLLDNNSTEAAQLLDKLYLSGSPILDILSKVITPTMRYIADQWTSEKISVYEEHRMSFMMRSHILHLEQYVPDTADDKSATALLACAPGEFHELPLELIALVLKINGWRTHILGINISIGELIKAARKIHPKFISITKTYATNESEAYFKKLFSFAEENNICVAMGGAAWQKSIAKKSIKMPSCVRFFPALKLFSEHLANYKRKGTIPK